MTATHPAGGPPLLRVLRGAPDAAELAALVTVIQAGALAAATAGAAAAEPTPPAPGSQWAAPARLVRGSVGASGWWQAGLPQ